MSDVGVLTQDERDPREDEYEGRESQFMRSQSVSERAYSELLAQARAHAAAATPLGGAPDWRFVGPRNVGGRIIALGQDPVDPRIVYAGSAQGGLWRSIDAGDSWERLGDRTQVFPVGAIAVAPGAPRTIYFGTGAHLPDYISGQGLFRATAAAPAGPVTLEQLVAADPATTAPANASPGAALRYTRIRVDPDDPTRFWAASQSGLWRCECPLAQPAVPRFTRDLPDVAGTPAAAPLASAQPANGIWPSHCTDLALAYDPRDTESMQLNGKTVRRFLVLYVGVDSVGVFRGRFDRKDGSVKFDGDKLDIPLGGVTFSRVQLAVCEEQPQHVYAIFADATPAATEVFHSSNSGADWSKGAQTMTAVGAGSGQADYDLVLEVAPDDPAVVVAGEVELCLSTDFGSHWTKILDWTQYDRGDQAQHADQHIALFDRGDHRRLWIGNDGGLTLARDLRLPAQAPGYFRKRSHGIYAGQVQDVSINPALGFMCAIGLQDNGTFLSLGGPTWYHVDGADGGAAAFNLANPHQVFTTWQRSIDRADAVLSDAPRAGGFDIVTFAAGDLPESVALGHRIRYRSVGISGAGSGVTGGPPFIGVLEQHPATAGALLAGRQTDAYASTNFGVLWTPLVAGTPLAPLAEVPALAFGPPDPHNPVAGNVDGWVGTSLGALGFTASAPAGPWLFPPAPGAPTPLPFPGAAQRITEIVAHPLDRRIVAVSVTGIYGRVFLTYDQGRSWLDVTEPTPSALSVAPVGASLRPGDTRAFTALATYPGPGLPVNVTARAAWRSSNPAQATIQTAQPSAAGTAIWGFGNEGALTGFGVEGQVTGVAAGTPTITATLLAGVPNGSAAQPVNVSAAAPASPAPVAQPRTIVPGSLPPGAIPSVIFDPAPAAGSAATLLAGTLMGVYALGNVPVVQSLAIQPAGPLTFQTGAAAYQLRCVATYTDGTQVDVTRDVDWSTNAAGVATVSNAAPNGQVTIVGVGNATIAADRGGQNATIALTVQAAAAPAAPALPAPPPAANPTVNVNWQLYNSGLPQVLVTDFERVGGRNAIRAATFGLGVFECVTSGAPVQQLYIRQTLVEDGHSYPRPSTPAAPAPLANPPVPDDPRLPAGAVALDYMHAFDIRLDAPPYSFFDDVVDGVEFDEQLEVGDAVPTEDNYVYVQVHNAGRTAVPTVTVHLYAAGCAPADVINPVGPAATPFPASLEGTAPIADFYGQANRDPIPASFWKRVDSARVLPEVKVDEPGVVRFTWRPDGVLSDSNVALLAVCEGHPASADTLPAVPAGATLSAFILAERRAALRIVHVGHRPPAALYIRDGVADDTLLGGYPVSGRSPDIMVVRPDIAAGTAADAFKDFLARRPHDTLSHSADNHVYVRVHNRRHFTSQAQVKVFLVPLDDDNAPGSDTTVWKEYPAGAPPPFDVPAKGVGYGHVVVPAADVAPPAGANKAYLLLALVQSADTTDPFPTKERAMTPDDLWDFVTRAVDSDNAAARVLPFVP